ncbi:MAG: hypothetical protein LT070_02450 [Solirubrobacteraceae bacterium]|nr:hypothetical protein [Solirubrobacteraceae bacterium]
MVWGPEDFLELEMFRRGGAVVEAGVGAPASDGLELVEGDEQRPALP